VIERALRGEAGYSLVEMLTVMVIMGVVFAGITDVFIAGSKAQADQDRRFQAQLSTRLAMDKIRKDIHCATTVSPYTASSITLDIPTGCGGDVSWCTAAVGGSTNRYALYRQAGASCSAGTGVQIADYLTNANAFPAFTHTNGCACLASLDVTFAVSVQGDTRGAYKLEDKIYLRNSERL
jgi:prepilin-type N-terminal cleavage/methylation domain-containing protein